MSDPAQLASDAATLGVHLNLEQTDRLQRYAALLMRWSKVHNLTAIDSADSVTTHHLLDSLAVVPAVRSLAPEGAAARLLDVGSGGGLPAIPLAIALPQLDVTAIDKVGKKVAFLTQARLELGLRNLTAVHARVETLRPAQPFDVIVSRAFSTLDRFVNATRHLLRPGGCWLAMKGQRPDEELATLARVAPEVRVESVATLRVPRLAAERHLVLLRPVPPA
jgi:16S rRNA (guanine527-N7)-methyltransferase